MSTPTPDEQALTEQIARAIEVADAETLGYERCLPEDGYLDHARAVLPVVKAAQRDAARGALDGLATTYRDVSTVGILQYRDAHYGNAG